MAKKKITKTKNLKDEAVPSTPKIKLKSETTHWIIAIAFLVLATFLILASVNNGGVAGDFVYNSLSHLLGIGYFILPVLFLMLGTAYSQEIKHEFALTRTVGSVIFLVSSLGAVELLTPGKGGIVGNLLSAPLVKLFDFYATLIFLVATMLVSIIVIFDAIPDFKALLFWKKAKTKNEEFEEMKDKQLKMSGIVEDEKADKPKEAPEKESGKEQVKEKNTLKGMLGLGKKDEEDFGKSILAKTTKVFESKDKNITLPLNLLSKDKGKPGVGDIKANANIIKRALYNFGIIVEMDEISIGPSVTRYALKPAEGVKLSRIVGLQNDLSLALAAHPLRIEAPIPGKALVGIEIPNSTKTMVGLGTLFENDGFKDSKNPLTIALGKDISGLSHFSNLAKAPHMLIAGSTGSGKSVTIHTLITSLLYRNKPSELKFIMIDPKRVELTLYKNIPHLLTPVITDPKKAILALKWAVKEMERRYEVLEGKSVRDIQSYHKNIFEPAKAKKDISEDDMPEAMPYIVVIIDELADIMQAYPRELESAIVRLAQMSRAVGIHLILSTQRPSVNVITGLIKANVPTRIALQVASQVDSRTILDMSGAEKLLGAGDMLYLSGEMSKPRRIQAAYVSENELKDVVTFLKNAYADEIPDEIDISVAGQDDKMFEGVLDNEVLDDDGGEDDLYETARDEVIKAGKASTSYIQRKLRVGYARAARLMDILEDRGIVGPADGSKARDVLVGKESKDFGVEKEEAEMIKENNGYLNNNSEE